MNTIIPQPHFKQLSVLILLKHIFKLTLAICQMGWTGHSWKMYLYQSTKIKQARTQWPCYKYKYVEVATCIFVDIQTWFCRYFPPPKKNFYYSLINQDVNMDLWAMSKSQNCMNLTQKRKDIVIKAKLTDWSKYTSNKSAPITFGIINYNHRRSVWDHAFLTIHTCNFALFFLRSSVITI